MIRSSCLGICYTDTGLEATTQGREEGKKMKGVGTPRQVLKGLGRQGLFFDEDQ